MTIFSYVTGVGAVACYPIFLDRALSTVLAGVRPLAGIDELTIVEGDLSNNSLGIYNISRLDNVVVDFYVSHTTDQARTALATADDDFAAELEGHCEEIALLVPVVDYYTQLALGVIECYRVPGFVVRGKFHGR